MVHVEVCAFFAIVVPLAICQFDQGSHKSEPALPFYDWKACPFEGCVYRQWTARSRVIVYNTWRQDRQPVAKLSGGDSILGLKGVVITFRPGIIRLDRDLPEHNLKRGETILTYAYRGEGYSAVWLKGQYYSDFNISFTKWPDGQGCNGEGCAATYVDLGQKAWWAEVKLKSGLRGWVNMDALPFDGVDLLGDMYHCYGCVGPRLEPPTRFASCLRFLPQRAICGTSGQRPTLTNRPS